MVFTTCGHSASRRIANIHLSADRFFFSLSFSLFPGGRLAPSLLSADGVHRSPRSGAVIAGNHSRGRYERKSADAHFFSPKSPRVGVFSPRRHLPRFSLSRARARAASPGTAREALLQRADIYTADCRRSRARETPPVCVCVCVCVCEELEVSASAILRGNKNDEEAACVIGDHPTGLGSTDWLPRFAAADARPPRRSARAKTGGMQQLDRKRKPGTVGREGGGT